MTQQIIPLAPLLAPLPAVDLGPGGVHAVQHISGEAMELVHAARTQGDGLKLWDAAALCIPTAAAADVRRLALQQIEAIVTIASGQVESVLAAVGNGAAPASGGAPAPVP